METIWKYGAQNIKKRQMHRKLGASGTIGITYHGSLKGY